MDRGYVVLWRGCLDVLSFLVSSPLCSSSCVSAMHASSVAVSASTPVGGGEVQVLPQVADSPIKRRRLSVKGAAPSLLPPPPRPPVADSPFKHRRLSVKGPAPSLLPPLPRSPSPVLPFSIALWNDQNEGSFGDLTHRHRYRMIYNKFQYWWFSVTQSG